MPRVHKTSKLAPVRLRNQMKVLKAIELRLQGRRWEDIARESGFSCKANAWRAVNAWYDQRQAEIAEGVEQCRRLDVDRLDRMLVALSDRIEAGETRAIDTALRVLERRARLLGLDAPARQELTGAEGGPVMLATPTIYVPAERSDAQSTGLPAATPPADATPE